MSKTGKGVMQAQKLVGDILKRPESYFDINLELATTIGGLTRVPIIAESYSWEALEYLTSKEVMDMEKLYINEVGSSGTVNLLKIKNDADEQVLIPASQVFMSVGTSKQDRAVVMDTMIKAGSEVEIPVVCVEHGRWSPRSMGDIERYGGVVKAGSGFDNKHLRFAPSRISRSFAKAGLHSFASSGDNYVLSAVGSNIQGEVWQEVDEILEEADAKTSTSTLSEALKKEEEKKGKESFDIYENEIGSIFADSSRVLGMEFYDKNKTWMSLLEPTIRRYKMEVRGTDKKFDNSILKTFIEELGKTGVLAKKGVCLGYNVSLKDSASIMGSGLVVENTPTHLTVVPGNSSKKKKKPGDLRRPFSINDLLIGGNHGDCHRPGRDDQVYGPGGQIFGPEGLVYRGNRYW